MGLQMSARKVPESRVSVTLDKETPEEAQERVRLGWSHRATITVRALTPEELTAPREELPGLYWSHASFLALEMVADFRDWEAHQKASKYDSTADGKVEHDAFVKANQAHPFSLDMYLARRREKGLKCHLDGLETESFYKEYFERARDFIRECALNNYYATYG